jgi:hypothetical protein
MTTSRWPASLAPENKKPRRLLPEASVLVLRLLLDPVGSTEEGSTLLAYSGRKLSQASWHHFGTNHVVISAFTRATVPTPIPSALATLMMP